MRIAIGTTNPSKISAVEDAFKTFFPDTELEFIPVSVESGISDQPMSDDETSKGALNRAHGALQATQNADYGVGIEGGLQQVSDYWMVGNIAAVAKNTGVTGVGASARVLVPEKIMAQVHSGAELNDAVHQVTDLKDNGKKGGVLGLLSKGAVTRSSACHDAVLLALSGVESTI